MFTTIPALRPLFKKKRKQRIQLVEASGSTGPRTTR